MMRAVVVLCSLAVSAFAGPPLPVSDAEFAGSLADVRTRTAALTGEFAAASHWMQDRELLALLADKDPGVRIAALRYARSMPRIGDLEVRRHVSRMAKDEPVLDVRVEAVKSLYWVAQYNEIQRLLLDIARGDAQPRARAMAYKALHTAASHSSGLSRDILYAARNENDPEVKKAVLWALADCSGQPDVRRELMAAARNPALEEGLRVEAVKSLFNAMGYSEIHREVIRLAFDESQPKGLRLAAILSLSAVSGTEISRAIEGLLRNPDPEIRAAAVKAAGGLTEELRRFFHLGYKLNDRYVSPIENE